MSQRPEPEPAVRGFMFVRVTFKAGETITHQTHRREINKPADLPYLYLDLCFTDHCKDNRRHPLGFNVP